jgi:hypothetical protein
MRFIVKLSNYLSLAVAMAKRGVEYILRRSSCFGKACGDCVPDPGADDLHIVEWAEHLLRK